MRKRIIITVVIIVLIITALLGWFLLKDRAPAAPGSLGNLPSAGGEPLSGENSENAGFKSRLSDISKKPVVDYWTDGEEIYFVDLDGYIYKEGERLPVQPVPLVSEIKLSLNREHALITFGTSGKKSFVLLNLINKSWEPLPLGVTSATWAPHNSNEIAYITDSPGGGLYTMEASSGAPRKILNLALTDAEIDWPNPESIYLGEKPSSVVESSYWLYDLTEKSLRKIAEGNGLIIRWILPNLALKLDRGDLSLIDEEGNPKTDIAIETLPEKCAVYQKTAIARDLYCAIPDENFTLPRDLENYLKQKMKTIDNLFVGSIDAAERSGRVGFSDAGAGLLPFGSQLDMSDVLITKDGRLFFINRIDKHLYAADIVAL